MILLVVLSLNKRCSLRISFNNSQVNTDDYCPVKAAVQSCGVRYYCSTVMIVRTTLVTVEKLLYVKMFDFVF